MWLILPDEGCSTEDVLSSGTLDTLLNGTARSSSLRVNLSLPKFNISSGLELSGSLQKMGISDVFNPAISNYSALLPNSSGVYLGRISHAARVTIDEEGIEAAAYTVLENCGAAISPEEEIDFVLDRPFAFVIESRDGLPLFTGIVNDP
jgi:serine protease inhibitor